MTDEELAKIKRNMDRMTQGEWECLTPDEKMADLEAFWQLLISVEGNINKLDPNDPAWLEKDENTDDGE